VVLDHGRVAAAGTLAELLDRREVRLRLSGVDDAVHARLRAEGPVTRSGDWFTVELPGAAPADGADPVPALVRDLVGAGVLVHAVEPGHISLEERLLGILRGEHR
jgi:ABC-2 type transport system ATP-binding protein